MAMITLRTMANRRNRRRIFASDLHRNLQTTRKFTDAGRHCACAVVAFQVRPQIRVTAREQACRAGGVPGRSTGLALGPATRASIFSVRLPSHGSMDTEL